jgi:esterase/lipase superfamily enzyme
MVSGLNKVSADTGYFNEANVTDESAKDVDLYVATGRDKLGDAVEMSTGTRSHVSQAIHRCSALSGSVPTEQRRFPRRAPRHD